MGITTEIYRRVWLDNEGVCFEIGPDADGLDLIRLRTPNEKSSEYFGKIDVTMDSDAARALAKALLKAADESDLAQRQ